MGLLVNGKWVDEWYDTAATGGRFMRPKRNFATGSRPTEAPAPRVRPVFGPRQGAILFLCVAGLPMGASNANFSCP